MNLNLYTKAFLAGFTPAFLIYLLSNYEKAGVSMIALFYGLIFGLILLIFAMMHYLLASKKTDDVTEAMSVKHQRDLDLKLNQTETFSLIRAYVEKMNYRIKQEKPNTFILCKTPFNIRTFGNWLSFEISSAANNVTHVRINSKPCISTTLIDYGDSLGRIQEAEKYLINNQNSA